MSLERQETHYGMAKARSSRDSGLSTRQATPLSKNDPFERRIMQLRGLALEEGASELDERSVQRARSLLKRIRLMTRSAENAAHLANPFLTVIGGGFLQMEWKHGARYLEAEIPPEGPFSVWQDGPSGEGESHPEDVDEICAW